MLGKVRFEAVSSKLVDAKGAREEAAAVADCVQLNKPSITERREMKLHNAMSHPLPFRNSLCTFARLIAAGNPTIRSDQGLMRMSVTSAACGRLSAFNITETTS